jgi:hypothetical protein
METTQASDSATAPGWFAVSRIAKTVWSAPSASSPWSRIWRASQTGVGLHELTQVTGAQFPVREPERLINAGAPPVVGMGLKPPIWSRAGDVVELGIAGLDGRRQSLVGPR